MAKVRVELHEADGRLPHKCMCCGEEASITKTRNMAWCPPWTVVLILAGLLPYAIVVLILTKRARVQVPLCAKHANHWLKRGFLIWGSLLAGIGFVVLLAVLYNNVPRAQQESLGAGICFVSVGLAIAWIIVVIVAQTTAIRPTEITDYEITLGGVAPEFVEAVHDVQQRRRDRLSDRDREKDWDDDDVPRRKQQPSEGIEEERPRRTGEESDGIEEDRPRKRPSSDDNM